MKMFFSICSLALMSSAAYSADMDYKHCMGAVNQLEGITGDFMEMNSEGIIKVKKGSGSMKTEGDSLVYTDYSLITSSDKKNPGVVKAEKLTDIEIFKVRYESVEDGQPSGKIIGIDYSVKDKKNSSGGQLSMVFNYKNGHCIPSTTKKSVFGQKGKAGTFLINAFAKVAPTTRGWDLYKCKRLYDYVEANKKLEMCLSSATELAKLQSVMNDLTDTNPGTATKQLKVIEKTESDIKEAFVIYSAAKSYLQGCEESGYRDILSDKEYWTNISAESVNKNVEEKATLAK